MTAPIRLTRQQARALHLAAQGIESGLNAALGPATVQSVIQRMGVLQIDTIHVVARSHYLVLWSRLGNYNTTDLDQLLEYGAIFEYWSHAASFLPIEHYPIHMGRRHESTAPRDNWRSQLEESRQEADQILDLIRERGAVRAADFSRETGTSSGWWDWKPEKLILELLLRSGELMVARRERFQRLYDLPDRIHPGISRRQLASPEDAHRQLVVDTVRAMGVATPKWLPDYFRLSAKSANQALAAAIDAGELLPAEIELIGPALVHPAHKLLAEQASTGALTSSRTTILSPFDPVVWDRQRASQLFDFDYLIECYTPAAKRVHGYFTLPILHRGALVGRLDAKAHRRDKVFEVKAIHFEPGALADDSLLPSLSRALEELAAWHGTPEVSLVRTQPASALRPLQRLLR